MQHRKWIWLSWKIKKRSQWHSVFWHLQIHNIRKNWAYEMSCVNVCVCVRRLCEFWSSYLKEEISLRALSAWCEIVKHIGWIMVTNFICFSFSSSLRCSDISFWLAIAIFGHSHLLHISGCHLSHIYANIREFCCLLSLLWEMHSNWHTELE